MNAIVTGGSGFIGSHLVDALIEKEYHVSVIDNLSSGNINNIEHHQKNPNFKFYEMDISAYNDMTHIFKDADWVFHLAALADIVPSIEKPIEYHKANVDGTINILEASRKADVKKFIYTASSSCYGIPDKYPTPENTPIKPEYPYALTKYLGEQYALHWNKLYKLPSISLRLFNVYGPRARTSGAYGAVFGVFLAQKANNKPFTVVGDGSQTRDFTYVSDVANAMSCAAESNINGEIFNIGSGNTYSVNRLVELIEGEVLNIPKRPGEPDCTFADISKAKEILGWTPKISLEQGVKTMLDNIDMWKNAPVWTPEKIKLATKDWFKYLSK
jgi:UDP-glucose 4-epimerase